MTEEEMRVIHKYYGRLRERVKSEENLQKSHSIDEIDNENEMKKEP